MTRPSLGKIALSAIGLGLLGGYLSVWAIPHAVGLGLADATAQNLPFVGLALGAGLGVAAVFVQRVKDLLVGLLCAFICGAVFWLFALLLGGLALSFGASEKFANAVPVGAFWFGLALGLVPAFAYAADRMDGLQRLFRKR